MNIRPFEDKAPQIHATALINESAVIIGDVTIGAHSSVWPMCVIRGDVHAIGIGQRSNIQDGSVLHVTHDSHYTPGGLALTIGDDVTIGHSAVVHACTLEDACLIGMNATVLDGAIVKKNAMVAAGSVVGPGKILEGGYLYVGSPAKAIRPLKEREIEFFLYSAQNYVKLAKRYLHEESV